MGGREGGREREREGEREEGGEESRGRKGGEEREGGEERRREGSMGDKVEDVIDKRSCSTRQLPTFISEVPVIVLPGELLLHVTTRLQRLHVKNSHTHKHVRYT